jgi:hypothetical protein
MILLLLMLLALACQRSYTPKPRGFLRIDFPAREYVLFDSVCPYTFEYPSYGKIVPDTDYLTEPCWINIDFPDFDGIIHIKRYIPTRNLRFTGYYMISRETLPPIYSFILLTAMHIFCAAHSILMSSRTRIHLPRLFHFSGKILSI